MAENFGLAGIAAVVSKARRLYPIVCVMCGIKMMLHKGRLL